MKQSFTFIANSPMKKAKIIRNFMSVGFFPREVRVRLNRNTTFFQAKVFCSFLKHLKKQSCCSARNCFCDKTHKEDERKLESNKKSRQNRLVFISRNFFLTSAELYAFAIVNSSDVAFCTFARWWAYERWTRWAVWIRTGWLTTNWLSASYSHLI